jgi:hypothetical protein
MSSLPSTVLLQQAEDYVRVSVMVFNATVNNISAVSWRLALLMEETGVPEEKHKLLKNFITKIVFWSSI